MLRVEVGLRLVVHPSLSNCLHSALLLVVEHFVALDVAEVAHVAHISESVVVVETSLTSPVSNSFLILILPASRLALPLPLLILSGLGFWSVRVVGSK